MLLFDVLYDEFDLVDRLIIETHVSSYDHLVVVKPLSNTAHEVLKRQHHRFSAIFVNYQRLRLRAENTSYSQKNKSDCGHTYIFN